MSTLIFPTGGRKSAVTCKNSFSDKTLPCGTSLGDGNFGDVADFMGFASVIQ